MEYKKKNLPIVAVLCVGFCNIARKLMVNWGLELENFLKEVPTGGICKSSTLQLGKALLHEMFFFFFYNTIKEKLDDDLC